MLRSHIYVLLLASLFFPFVLGKYNYFEHYFSKYHHHKSSSTTPSLPSTSETIIAEVSISSSQDDIASEKQSSSEDDISSKEKSSSEDSNERHFIVNTTAFYPGARDDGPGEYIFVARVATIVGSIVFVIVVLACIVCCCPKCCRGTERRGFIVGDRGTEVLPQPVITRPPQQPSNVQHLPPEYTQESVQQFPPQYQQPVLPPTQYAPAHQPGYQYSPVHPQPPYSPVQAQIHYSPIHPGYQNTSTLQFYNPPEAPPPYEPTAPTKG